MRLCHPPDGSTSPKYKLLCFITTKFFCKEKNALAFNRDRCCHLVLCLRLIPFHWTKLNKCSIWVKKALPLPGYQSDYVVLSLCIEIVVYTMREQGSVSRTFAYSRALDMGLTSAEGQKLECFKWAANNVLISTMKI